MDKILLRYLPQVFPDRQNLRILSFERITDGWESDVYSFRLESTSPGNTAPQCQDFILRIYPGDDLPAARQKAEGEVRSLKILYQSGYPVPKVYHLASVDSPFNQPMMIMEKIDGYAMWPLLFHHENPAIRQWMLETFCRLFVQLHQTDWRPAVQAYFPDLDQFEVHSPTDLIDRLLGRFQPILQALPIPGFTPVIDWIEAHKAEAAGEQVSVTHNDFHPNNILVTSAGAAYVIDWTSTDLSDSRFDLAWTLLLILSYEGQEARDSILQEYERQLGHPIEHLEFYEVCSSLRRLYSIVASILYGAEKLGMRPGAEKIMLSQKDSIRRVYELLRSRTGISVPEVESILA